MLRTARTELLAGIVVALALIPEAISFSIISGVAPEVGLFASFTMSVVIAVLGGRPAMISAATGSTALVVSPLSHRYGLQYLLAAVILGGALQLLLGTAGISRLLRFVPKAVVSGFANGLAVLIFLAQLPELIAVPWPVYPLFAIGLLVIVGLPRVAGAVPGPLVAVVALTAFTVAAGVAVPTVGGKGALPAALPRPAVPDVPLTAHTLGVLLPYSIAFAVVGLLESMLTARLVDELTATGSNKVRECLGLGVANIVTGFFGGLGGCAMIGQTLINIKSGARTRVSTFVAGVALIGLCIGLGPWVARIPMAALVAVMVMVAVGTFRWDSISRQAWRAETVVGLGVMLLTVAGTVATGDLAVGVLIGCAATALLSWRSRRRGQREAVPDTASPSEQTAPE
jgi:SulP family sulfate permease